MSQPPPLPLGDPQVISYASPTQYQQQDGVWAWRQGNVLIIPKNGLLPMRCVKCNAPAEPRFFWRKTLYWHTPALYILILFPGLLIYAIVALIVRKGTKVEAGLCEVHGKLRRKKVLIGWLTAILGFASIIGAIVLGTDSDFRQLEFLAPFLGLGGGALLLFSLFWALLATRVMYPRKIDNSYAWLGGAGTPFLDSIPDTGQHPI